MGRSTHACNTSLQSILLFYSILAAQKGNPMSVLPSLPIPASRITQIPIFQEFGLLISSCNEGRNNPCPISNGIRDMYTLDALGSGLD